MATPPMNQKTRPPFSPVSPIGCSSPASNIQAERLAGAMLRNN